MKKKLYERPTMTVVKLRHQPQLLQASASVDATMSTVWDEETI